MLERESERVAMHWAVAAQRRLTSWIVVLKERQGGSVEGKSGHGKGVEGGAIELREGAW